MNTEKNTNGAGRASILVTVTAMENVRRNALVSRFLWIGYFHEDAFAKSTNRRSTRMAEKEYIERDALIRHLNDEIKECGDDCMNFRPIAYGTILGLMSARSFANTLPAADVAPVVHGEWIPSPDGINPIKCRRCGTVAPYRLESDFNHDIGLYPYKSNYCPHCGARMDGGKDG